MNKKHIDIIANKVLVKVFYSIGFAFLIQLVVTYGLGYFIIQDSAHQAVKDVFDETEVKKEINEYKYKILSESNDAFSKIQDEVINRLKTVRQVPFQIYNNGIVFYDSTGKTQIIEYGRNYTNEDIKLLLPFGDKPVISVTLIDSNLNGIKRIIKGPFTITGDRHKFRINMHYYRRGFNPEPYPRIAVMWTAIGH